MKKLFANGYTSWPGTMDEVPTPKVPDLQISMVFTAQTKEVNHG
ncbi:hypothetical protein [Larkinella knui]|nr:hypothetical protein [Larkinella knui]